MTDATYNGWRNYETWRVNLEHFDGATVCDITGAETLADFLAPHIGQTGSDIHAIADAMRDYVEECIEASAPEGLAQSYALAFVSRVDWAQLARHKLTDELRDALHDITNS